MRSPYDQLWSLPMRTLDPHLARLRAVLRGPAAPTWVVAWGDLDSWNIDAHDRTRLELATHYRRVAQVCGHAVYLHDGAPPHPGSAHPLPVVRDGVQVLGGLRPAVRHGLPGV